MTDEQTQALVKECGLDWQRGFMPLFDGDPTNRYAVLVEAATAPLLTQLEQLEALVKTLELQSSASIKELNERSASIAALDAKLAQRVPDGGHPMQPVVIARDKVHRFLENKMVNHLYEWARDRGMGLNEMAVMGFSDEDRMQFAQLIGYSASGYGGLSFVTDKSAEEADRRSAMLSAAPAAPEQQEPKRQYYFKVNGCTAKDCYETECICWHDEGTGPENGTAPNYLKWRAKPVAQAPNAQQAEPYGTPMSERAAKLAADPVRGPRIAALRERLKKKAESQDPCSLCGVKGFHACAVAQALNAQQAEAQQPLFWYRPCGDGLYEGPHHNNSVGGRMMREERPDAWKPLFTRPQPAQLQALSEEEVRDALLGYVEGSTYEDNLGGLSKCIQSALAAKNWAVLK